MSDHEIHTMKTAKNYIKRICDQIADRLAGITMRYQYKDASQTHLLEITPKHIAESREFAQVAQPLLFEFYAQFPGENLCFISDNSLARITNPEFVITVPRTDELALEGVFAFLNGLRQTNDFIGLTQSAFRISEAEQPYVILRGDLEPSQAEVFSGGWVTRAHDLSSWRLGSEVTYQFDLGNMLIWLPGEASQFLGSRRLETPVNDKARFWIIDDELLQLSPTEYSYIALAS
jgi:hypothetical protein